MLENDKKLQYIQQRKLEAKRIREEYWGNLNMFTNPHDIPELPVVNEEEWKNFYVPILIKCGAIPKIDLIVGQEYLGTCRNTNKAVWTGKEFIYTRKKFGSTYKETINHFEDDNGYDLFVPLKKL